MARSNPTGQVQVENRTSGVVHLGEDATLLPGDVTKVDAVVWEKWKSNKVVASLVDDGYLLEK